MRADAVRVPWYRRLEARVLVTGVAVCGLSLIAVSLAGEFVVSSHERRKASEQLAAAKTAFDQLLANRARFAVAQLRLIAELPVFRAHLANPDARSDDATMNEMAEHYRKQLSADGCVITGIDGRTLARAGLGSVGPLTPRPGAPAAAGRPQASSIVRIGDDLYFEVSERALFVTEELGALTAIYRLSDELAGELSSLTHTEVSFLVDGRVISSSLPPASRSDLGGALGESLVSSNQVRYHARRYPLALADRSGRADLILMADWSPVERMLADVRRSMLWVSALTFGLAIAGLVVFSRRVSRPMKVIAQAARDIAAGAWERRVPRAGSAEGLLLADAFNDMTASLIHWHHEAEERLTRLRLAYERFSAVTESASDAIISVDERGLITFWNPGAARMFGLTEAAVNGLALRQMIEPGDWTRFDACVGRVKDGTRPTGLGETCDLRGVARDGRQLSIEMSVAPWHSEEGTGLTVVIRDATARVAAQRHLEDARDAAVRASEAKSAFVANMSHELRTPLSAIFGYTELLLENADARRQSGDAADLGHIRTAAKHLLQLVNQVLELATIEANRITLDIEPVDIGDLVRDVAALAAPGIEKNGNQLQVEPPARLMVEADRARLTQVLVNLLANAGKFTKDGTVRLRVSPNAHTIDFEVQDTGIGIDRSHLDLIFDQFSQVDASTSRQYRRNRPWPRHQPPVVSPHGRRHHG